MERVSQNARRVQLRQLGTIMAFPVLCDLHHEYRRVALVDVSEVQLERMAKVGITASQGLVNATSKVVAFPVLGGLHHEYREVA